MIEEKPSGGEKWGGHLNSRSVVLTSNDEARQSGSRDPSFVYEEPPPNPRRALPLLEIGREDRPSLAVVPPGGPGPFRVVDLLPKFTLELRGRGQELARNRAAHREHGTRRSGGQCELRPF